MRNGIGPENAKAEKGAIGTIIIKSELKGLKGALVIVEIGNQ